MCDAIFRRCCLDDDSMVFSLELTILTLSLLVHESFPTFYKLFDPSKNYYSVRSWIPINFLWSTDFLSDLFKLKKKKKIASKLIFLRYIFFSFKTHPCEICDFVNDLSGGFSLSQISSNLSNLHNLVNVWNRTQITILFDLPSYICVYAHIHILFS